MDNGGINLGQYENKIVFLKAGKFGKYIEWNKHKKSMVLPIPLEQIRMSDVVHILDQMRDNKNNQTEKSIIRTINNDLSIRNGKYGHYIYYKTNKMKKPIFLNISEFTLDYVTCGLHEIQSWFKVKYKMNIEV
jgi:DNA topoisomerase-1